MINPLSIPAILALLLKLALLYAALRTGHRGATARLFRWTVVFSMWMSIVEVSFFNLDAPDILVPGIKVYYVASLGVVALLAHLAAIMAFGEDVVRSRRQRLAWYGVPAALAALVLFTPWVVAGAQSFREYAVIRVPGPLYGLFETYIILGSLVFALLPVYGLFGERSPRVRSQCKLWMLTATPAVIVIVSVLLLLHFKVWIYTTTVVLPLPLTLHLAAVGYVVHSRRIVEIDYYIPLSRTRRRKFAFYRKLMRLFDADDVPVGWPEVVQRLSEIFAAPVCVLGPGTALCSEGRPAASLRRLPLPALARITALATLDDVRHDHPALADAMLAAGAAAVVPIEARADQPRQWVIIGEPFSSKVYTPRDVHMVGQMFRRLAHAISLPEPGRPVDDGAAMSVGTLRQRLQAIERQILESTLRQCGGNQAQAARQLGLRANTLHYKLRRHGIVGPEPDLGAVTDDLGEEGDA